MSRNNSKDFSVNVGDKNIDLMLRDPNLKDHESAEEIYNSAFARAVKSNALLRPQINEFLKQAGMWDDSKEAKLAELDRRITDAEKRILTGGFKKTDAYNLSLEIRKLRVDRRELLSDRLNYDNKTAEGQADNARFNYLVSVCTVDKGSQKPYFSNYEDFLNRVTDPVAFKASQKLASLLYGLEDDFEHKLPENEFLKRFKYVDNQLRLINSEGKLIDEKGRLIDENGRFIDEDGNFIDIDGNPINTDGSLRVENQMPFLDDDGNPIEDESVSVDEEKNIGEEDIKDEVIQKEEFIVKS